MFEFILDICPAVFAAGMITVGWIMDKKIRTARAEKVTVMRKAEYAAEVEKAGERVRRLMAASAPLAGESKTEQPLRKVCGVFASPEAAALWEK